MMITPNTTTTVNFNGITDQNTDNITVKDNNNNNVDDNSGPIHLNINRKIRVYQRISTKQTLQ